jgi:uncharacterized membrane protein
MKLLRENYTLVILLFLSVAAVLPFLHTGFFNIHDDAQIQRVFEMKVALLDGEFPVRWVRDLGYGLGYPIFNFYAPFPYYLGALISMVGIDALLATKLMIIFAVVGSAFSMYFLAKEFWGKLGALLSALLYILAPYHALDIYVRGDIGEVYAYLFAPLIFLSLWKYYKTTSYRWIVVGSLAFCALIISHNLSALMLFPFVLVTSIILFILKRSPAIFAISFLGILLSSFYFLPALLEMKYTNVLSTIGGKADFRDHFVCVRQLWDSPWMFGGSAPGCVDGLSFRLGKLHIIFGVVSVTLAALSFKKEKEKALTILVVFTFLLVSLALTLNQSKFIWESIPFMNFFQYPWRFLLSASLFSSFIGGSIIYFLSRYETQKYKIIFYLLYLVILVSPILLYTKLFAPQFYLPKSAKDYTSKSVLNFETSKISDEYMPIRFAKPTDPNQIVNEKVTGENTKVIETKSKTNDLLVKITADKRTKVDVRIPYFPAWKFYVNGANVNFEVTNKGVSLLLPSGQSTVEAKFEQTKVEKIANLLSLSGILILIAGTIYYKRKENS